MYRSLGKREEYAQFESILSESCAPFGNVREYLNGSKCLLHYVEISGHCPWCYLNFYKVLSTRKVSIFMARPLGHIHLVSGQSFCLVRDEETGCTKVFGGRQRKKDLASGSLRLRRLGLGQWLIVIFIQPPPVPSIWNTNAILKSTYINFCWA